MDTFVDRKFEDEFLYVDLASFVRCTFIKCELTYSGGGAADFEDCIFEDCSWTFEGAAVRTIDFLATVYRRTGTTGQDLVEGIFDSIRNSPVIDIRDEGRLKSRESISVKTTTLAS
ncbi:MAG: hypothetical protein M3457_16635 [Chloroflexota bacterium]|nr:hypothetical protein [Chloroflexota bacterium]